jgi:lipopolysaccharide transport system permease protein
MNKLTISASSLLGNRSLILEMVKRDIVGRYKGSFFGLMWSFFNPLLMLGVYTFAFGYVFKSKWLGVDNGTFGFAVALFPALLVFNYFADCVSRAPVLIVANASYVKKVVFPLEILAVNNSISGLFHLLIGLIVWFIMFLVVTQRFPSVNLLLFPLTLAPLILFTLGLSWFFSALGVYFRDLQQLLGIITSAMLFISPVFYPVSNVPGLIGDAIWINPMTSFIEINRNLLLYGLLPSASHFLLVVIGSIIALLSGAWFFEHTKQGFADVL